MASLAKRGNQSTYIWPGFVDALATLLMVIMFLLLVFVLAQFFMSEALTGRDQALNKLKNQIGELAELLSLERKENSNIRENLSQLSQELQISVTLQDDLKTSVSDLRKRSDQANETIDILQAQASAMRSQNAKLLAKSEMLAKQNDANLSKAKNLNLTNKIITEELTKAKNTIQNQLSELAGLGNDIALLKALKAELEAEILEMAKNLRKRDSQIAENKKIIKEKDDRIVENKNLLKDSRSSFLKEKELSASARAEIALLNQQMAILREQLSKIEKALDISEEESKHKNVQITALGKRLNIALASKVQELSKYRSEFFGRLRHLLGNRKDIRVVGDRFVFQSEVLFEKGESELGIIGRDQLDKLAATLIEVSSKIPTEIDWILRIDGHTDNDPINTSRHPSNWELSTDRAISVLKYLIGGGLPANRLVAAGFGQYHPLDKRSDEIAKRRNRRIEIKLTQR